MSKFAMVQVSELPLPAGASRITWEAFSQWQDSVLQQYPRAEFEGSVHEGYTASTLQRVQNDD